MVHWLKFEFTSASTCLVLFVYVWCVMVRWRGGDGGEDCVFACCVCVCICACVYVCYKYILTVFVCVRVHVCERACVNVHKRVCANIHFYDFAHSS